MTPPSHSEGLNLSPTADRAHGSYPDVERADRDLDVAATHVPAAVAPAARELVPKHDAFAAEMPDLSSVEDSAAAALSAGPTVPHSRGDDEGITLAEAQDGAATLAPTAGGSGDTRGVDLVLTLNADYDQVMAQFETALSLRAGPGAEEKQKALFAEQMVNELSAALQIPEKRVLVMDVERGSIVTKIRFQEGEGPSPRQLAEKLIGQWETRDPRLRASSLLKTLAAVEISVKDTDAISGHGQLDSAHSVKQAPDSQSEHVELRRGVKPMLAKRPVLEGLATDYGACIRTRHAPPPGRSARLLP